MTFVYDDGKTTRLCEYWGELEPELEPTLARAALVASMLDLTDLRRRHREELAQKNNEWRALILEKMTPVEKRVYDFWTESLKKCGDARALEWLLVKYGFEAGAVPPDEFEAIRD